MDVVERSQGLSELLLSQTDRKNEMDHLLTAYEVVERALESSPVDPWLSLLMGDICNRMFRALALVSRQTGVAAELKAAALFHDRTVFFYRQAARFENNPAPFVKLGLFLAKEDAMLDEAEEMFLRALDVCAKQNTLLDETALIELVSVLEKKSDNERARQLREETSTFIQFRQRWTGPSTEQRSQSPPVSRSGVRLGVSRDRGLSKSRSKGDLPTVLSRVL